MMKEKRMKTKLIIRWEKDDGDHLEEIWERRNDGTLYDMYISLMHLIRAIENVDRKV
jgi:hypothetical protein